MTESTNVEHQLTRLARVRDEELAGLESSPAARTLLAELVAGSVGPRIPVPRRGQGGRPSRRLVLAATVLAVLTAAMVIGPGVLATARPRPRMRTPPSRCRGGPRTRQSCGSAARSARRAQRLASATIEPINATPPAPRKR
jgi:hypothetical protein